MKKVFLILATMLIMATLGACGSNTVNNSQTEEATTALDISTQEGQNEIDEDEGNADEESYMYQMTEQEIQASIADYHGEYRCTADANSIVINDNGMYYDGAKLDIQSIGEGYVVLNNSNLIIILSAGTVSANFTHAEDNSYLDDYERIGGENVNHPDEQKADGTGGESTNTIQESEQVQLSEYMGTYINDSTNDSFILTDAFQLTNISVMHAVYGNEDHSANEISTTFTSNDLKQDADGNNYVDISTMYGCSCRVTFLSGNQIALVLQNGNEVYEGTFYKQ